MNPVPDPALDQFGPYVVQERLGLGGMATVHRAKKRGIEGYERNVALKRMLSHLAEDAGFVESFIREAKVASLLVHPNIAQVYDFGRINGVYYIAMELVQGFDLRKLLRHANRIGEPIPMPVILSILAEMCEALDYAHTFVDEHGQALGIVHRDVSPSNLIVAQNGHVKMIDFGIAKAQSRQLRTESGEAKGKLGYMSPEAAVGMQIDATADVFSGGVVAWELITAQPLFSAKSDFETMRRIREMEVVPPSRYNPSCPPALDQLVLSATARDARYRLHSAMAFRQKLDEIAQRMGISINARYVAEWIAPFLGESTAGGRSRNPSQYKMPLQAMAESAGQPTQNIRPSKLMRTREEAELATEIWGEDAQTVHAVGPDFSALESGAQQVQQSQPVHAPVAALPYQSGAQALHQPVPTLALPPPPRKRSKLPYVLAGGIIVAGAAIAVVLVLKSNKSAQPGDQVVTLTKGASLKFEIDPPNAIVEIGGKEIGHASPFEAALEPGLYTVTVRAPGFKKYTAPIQLREEEHQRVQVQLEHQVAHLVVDSTPRGLAITLDGKTVAQRTPAKLDVPPGDHHVVVTSAGGEQWQDDVSLTDDATQNVTAAFGVGNVPVTANHEHRHHAAHDPDPVPVAIDAGVAEVPIDAAHVEPVHVEPVHVDPPKVDPPKVTRVPVVPATSVMKLAGEMPTLRVHGNDTDGNISAKMCIDAAGAVTSVKVLKAPAEIIEQLQSALMTWRYKTMTTPVCFLLSVRTVVKRAD